MKPVSRRPTPPTQIPVKTPAPALGWNTVDNLASMAPGYAVTLENFITSNQGLSVRQGYLKWASNLPAPVTSLLVYNGRSGNNKMFAVCGGSFIDVTAGGTGSWSSAVSGQSTTAVYWEQAQQTYTQANTSCAIYVNGTDLPQVYDGSSFITASQTAGPWTTPGVFSTNDNNGSSVNIATFIDVCLHNRRLWFVQKNSTEAFYCDIAVVGGQLYAFDFGTEFKQGGQLHKLFSWTYDSGSATRSYLVAISTKGEFVVYTGTNPAAADTWQHYGTYKRGAPIGRRCVEQFLGDAFVLTQDGMYGMSSVLQSTTVNLQQALTYLISPTISDVVSTSGSLPGFEPVFYPAKNLVLLNVPQSSQANNYQFCFNTIQKGWSKFKGWPAQCFRLFNESLFFGGTDFVALSFFGYKDGAAIDGSGGTGYVANALSAFNPFDETFGPGSRKQAKQIKPYLTTGQSNPQVSVGVNVDFDLVPLVGPGSVSPVTGAVWDNAIWNSPSATWVGNLSTYAEWETVSHWPAEYLAVAISISVTSDTTWVSTEWSILPGNTFG